MSDLVFPNNADMKDNWKNNMSIRLFGNRIFSDQSLYEYLLEFLLVFISPKDANKENSEMKFHEIADRELNYYVMPRMALRRFIFYKYSKKDIKIPADEKAYKEIVELISKKIGNEDEASEKVAEAVEAMQDLFYGYAAVLKNRTWCAQSLLPIAPELIFCEAMINSKERIKLSLSNCNETQIEKEFDFSRHNFMGRSGEVYYLHILQALQERTINEKKMLEKLIVHLLTSNSKKFSDISNWIFDSWILDKKIDKKSLWEKKTLGFIPNDGYLESGGYAITELINYLSNEMHPINKLEILSKGIVFQVMRMMANKAADYQGTKKLGWVVDMRSKKNNSLIVKISAESYRKVDELFSSAINKMTEEVEKNIDPNEAYDLLLKSKKHTINMFKRLGKEMQVIIPIKGGNERFYINEDIMKFLVLSLIKPEDKMTFDHFLRELYLHFNIIIGPRQYKKYTEQMELEDGQASAFYNNELEFQNFLKSAGFLRELSDATSIVINPYKEVIC